MEITHELFPTLFSTSSSASVFITCSICLTSMISSHPLLQINSFFICNSFIDISSSFHIDFLFLCLYCISHVLSLESWPQSSSQFRKLESFTARLFIYKTVLLFSISFLSSIYLRFRILTAVRLFVPIYRQTSLTLCFSFVYYFSFCSFFFFILPFILLTVVCWFNKFVIEFFILSLHLVYSTFFFTILYLHV